MLLKSLLLSFLLIKVYTFNLKNHCHTRIPQRTLATNSTFSNKFAPFILNGSPANSENYKFKLSLHINGKFYCSASIIGARWSLTAAHCLEYNVESEHITLRGGSVNRLQGITFNVENYHIHPNYDPVILDYDIAVMKIVGTFDNLENIKPVILANEGCSTKSGYVVTLAGWGLNENGFYPEDLYEIEQTIVDNNRCYAEWGGDITGRMLCANVENQIDSCSGDSGGAVIKNGCLQVGIISFGSNICGFNIPSVFTRIENPQIRKFIRDKTGI